MRSRARAAVMVAGAMLLAVAATAVAADGTSSQGSKQYVVILKSGNDRAGLDAIAASGGTVERSNRIGVVTASSSDAGFAQKLEATRKVDAVGENSFFYEAAPQAVDAPPADPAPVVATGCAQQYNPPGGVGAGPDPLSVCQWDMRISSASPTGSYAVNQGLGAKVGIIDTGVDLSHQDVAPNLSVPLSCSFIRPSTPTSLPQEWETKSDCSTKSAVQDYAGHGTHVAGEVAAPINGVGVAGVAPQATIVGLKAGTAEGYFFTQEVTDALLYAGDKRLDVVNMSFFADPYLFNCHNDKSQQAIIKAISRAASYANQRGVVLVGSAGNEQQDLDHPGTDAISPDYPPGSEDPRDVGNNCVVIPAELPWTTTVSSIGPQKRLASYSSYGNSKVDVTAAGGAAEQAPNPYGRVLNAWSSTAPPVSATQPKRQVEDCQGPGGTPPCFQYGWIQGTSMASPHAAGVAALIRSANPGMPAMAVQARLQNTAMPMSCPPDDGRCSSGGQTNFYGNGLVDALAAGSR